MVLKDIKENYDQGKYQELLDQLSQLEDQSVFSSLTEEDQIEYIYYKSRTLGMLGRMDEGLKIAEESYIKFNSKSYNFHLLKLIIAQLDILIRMGSQKKAQEIISVGDSLLKASTSTERTDGKNWIAIFENVKGHHFFVKSEITTALHHCKQSLALNQEIGNPLEIAISLNVIGILYRNKGELNTALDYYEKSLEIFEKLGNLGYFSSVLNNMGYVYRKKGELNTALDYYQQSIEEAEKIGYQPQIASTLNNIGEVYRDKGDLDLALDYYQKSLEISEKISDRQEIIDILKNIGDVYRFKGELETASKYYQQSFVLNKETINNNLLTSIILFSLVQLTLDQHDLDKAQEYAKQLQELENKQNIKIIDQQSQIAKALVLESSSRLRHKVQAEKIFHQIAEEEVVDHKLSILARLHLCALLITELQITGGREVLEELKNHIEYLSILAKSQNSFSLLAETYFLQANLMLLELNLDKAHHLFSQARALATEKGFWKLTMKLSSQYDVILDQEDHWKRISKINTKLNEIITYTSFDKYLHQMIQKKPLDTRDISQELSISFYILDSSLNLLFSKIFAPEIHSEMISLFLRAISNHKTMNLYESIPIQQIKVQDYRILITSHQDLLFVYVFKGSSYLAIQKLHTLMEFIQKSPHVTQELFPAVGSLQVSSQPIFPQILDELFLNLDSGSKTFTLRDITNQKILSKENIDFYHSKTLLNYSSLWHPIKLMILKLLNHHRCLPATDLSRALGVSRGRLDFHIRSLIKNEFIKTKKEFIQAKPLVTYNLTHKGKQKYSELIQLLKNFYHPNHHQDKVTGINEDQEKYFFRLRTPWLQVLHVLSQLPKSGSIRKLAAATKYDKSTILRWIKLVEENAQNVNESFLNDLKLSPTKIEEFWDYIKKTKTFQSSNILSKNN